MKKSLVIAAAAMIGASAFAQTVTSANVVGYIKADAPAAGAYNLIALTQFTDGSASLDIQDLIGNIADLNSDVRGSSADAADKLYIYNGSGYDQYAVFEDGNDGPYWASVNEPGWDAGQVMFGNTRVNAATVSVARATACWLQTGTGGTPTSPISSGEVFDDSSYDVSLSSGYNLLSFPFSSSVNLTNLTVTGAATDGQGSSYADADQIFVYNGSGYDQYALYEEGTEGPYWASINEDGWDPGQVMFGNTTVNEANATIEMGTGFWYYSATAKTITFNQNYTID